MSELKKNMGIKVKIKTLDSNQNKIGYICRRLNSDLYEIWIKDSNSLLLLEKKDFIELKEKK